MKTRFRLVTKLTFTSIVLCTLHAGAAHPDSYDRQAQQILEATRIKGGLIVHVGCGDGKLTAALGAGAGYLVHGLETDIEKVGQAREYIQSTGSYGKVSVDRFEGGQMPYIDNLVNLVVVENPDIVSSDDLMRVLCPGGVAYVKRGNSASRTIKPRPQ